MLSKFPEGCLRAEREARGEGPAAGVEVSACLPSDLGLLGLFNALNSPQCALEERLGRLMQWGAVPRLHLTVQWVLFISSQPGLPVCKPCAPGQALIFGNHDVAPM